MHTRNGGSNIEGATTAISAFNSGVVNFGTITLGGGAAGGGGGSGGGWRELVPLLVAFCTVVLTAAGLYMAVLVTLHR